MKGGFGAATQNTRDDDGGKLKMSAKAAGGGKFKIPDIFDFTLTNTVQDMYM